MIAKKKKKIAPGVVNLGAIRLGQMNNAYDIRRQQQQVQYIVPQVFAQEFGIGIGIAPKLMRFGDHSNKPQKLNDLQQWMLDKYQGDWNQLASEPIQMVRTHNFGSIVDIKTKKGHPELTQFLLVDTEDNSSWINLWDFEVVKTPEEVKIRTKQQLQEQLKTIEAQLEELKKHKHIVKAYLSNKHLVVVTKPTFAIHRDTGKEIKSMPMGRWVFDILIGGNLNDVMAWNLDYAQTDGSYTNFHYFRCWGGHPGQTLPLFQHNEFLTIVDFLINYTCVYPHDGFTEFEMGRWALNRKRITTKNKVITAKCLRYFKEPTKWLIGTPTQDIAAIAELSDGANEEPEEDPFAQAKGKKAKDWVPVTKRSQVRIGSLVKLADTSRFYYQAPNIVGVITGFEDTSCRIKWQKDIANIYPFSHDLLYLKGQVFKEVKEEDRIQFNSNPGKKYSYYGDDQDGEGSMLDVNHITPEIQGGTYEGRQQARVGYD